MKLKQDPDDFRVEELTEVQPGPDGPFAFYRLSKRGWTTHDAISAVRRRWQLELRRVAWGGLKDRHANTTQYLTISRGPRRRFEQEGLRLEYLGQVRVPYAARWITGNRFDIVVRDLAPEGADRSLGVLEVLRQDGWPNYFDDQRFGSVSEQREFIAQHLIRGEFERALKLALAEPYQHDRADAKREKVILRESWGRWSECKSQLARGHARSIVDYLVHHPTDYRGAIERLRPDLQGLYLSAYQSYLWNAILSAWLAQSFTTEELLAVRLQIETLNAPQRLTDKQRVLWHNAQLPLPAARWPFDPHAPWAAAATEVLATQNLNWDQLKIRGLRKPFFTKGERAAWCVPSELSGATAPDEKHTNRAKLRLQFILPRGSYATLLVKRLLGRQAGRMPISSSD
jgi:tRNA pseudouridine13 synthase